MEEKVWKDYRKKRPEFHWDRGYLVPTCPRGYHIVEDHFRNRKNQRSMATDIDGIYVAAYCARNPRRRR